MVRKFFILPFVLLLAWNTAQAQLLTPKSDALYSSVLKQNRAIDVYLPKDSEKDAVQRFETLYVLDGDGNTALVASIVTFMQQEGLIPPIILVSVPNVIDEHSNSRNLDFTPTVSGDAQRSGGAANFLRFLKTELIPYIDQHYPTNRVRLIQGHSLGGLFVTYALVHEPDLFDAYLILDPSLWWDKHVLYPGIEEALPNIHPNGKAIYIAARAGQPFEGMGVAGVKPLFEQKAPHDLNWQIVPYSDESHGSLKLRGTYDSLRFAYRGYTRDSVSLFPSSGIVIKGKPVYLGVDGNAELYNLHFTTDGSEPMEASPKVTGPIAISDPEKTRVKMISTRGIFDRDLPLGLKTGVPLPPSPHAKPTPTWRVALYPTNDARVGRKPKAFKSFDANKSLEFAGAGRETFSGTAERDLEISSAGYYVFGLASNGSKARLSVAGKPLVEMDGANVDAKMAYIVPLNVGVYPVRLEFQRTKDTKHLGLLLFQCKEGEAEWWKNQVLELDSGK